MADIETEQTDIDFNNISKNKKRNKKRDWNSYGVVTKLVTQFKKTNSDEDMLAVIKALEGIINTYTIILAPGNADQAIGFLNPYMKKFLGMFLSKAEQVGSNYQTYMQAVYRVRWIMRHYTYEDIYNIIITEIINIVRKMKVIEGCDCIYYIQFMAKFKIHSEILKHAKDAIVCIHDMPNNFGEEDDDSSNEDIDKLQCYYTEFSNDSEDRLIRSLYDNIDITAITRTDDIFAVLTYYEKYLLYLIEYIGLNMKQILSIVKHETQESLDERLEDIKYKITVLSNE